MSSRQFSAVAIALALVVAPVGQAAVWAATPAPTVVSLQATIGAAARSAASADGFQALSPEAKLAAIQASITGALSTSGASPEMIAQALIAAVKAGIISGGVAIAVASVVAPEFAQMVANNPVVQAQLNATGQTGTVTGSINGNGSVSVLVNLQGAAGGGGGAPVTAAPFDPCAGVVAAYCGG